MSSFAADFASPPNSLRGAPFWGWNGRLDRDRLLRQIGHFQEMGLGGFMIHCRTGLRTEYLGTEFLDRVRDCVAEASRRGLHAWLYDEDRWPSGFAGGLVTSDPRHRVRHLLVTTAELPAAATRTLLARWALRLGDAGGLESYRRLAEGESVPAGHRLWYGWLDKAHPPIEVGDNDDSLESRQAKIGPSSWFNNQTYVDTMSPAAIRRFIEVTHEAYHRAVGKDFGGTIPAIFTDEPQVAQPSWPATPASAGDCLLPWTTDFADSHLAAHGCDPLDRVPAILWDAADSAEARWCFWDHVAARFAAAYADQIGDWCEEHGLAHTGHLMCEHALPSQIASLGEAMRHYRRFRIPGIDLLCDGIEILTAKQAQSAKHQFGRSDMLSELYGVTDWDFPFAGHKAQGDWQAALGVTIRSHHLAWMGMGGEAKRDYPASIFYQSPWYREYAMVEDHFARLAVTLRQGRPRVRVAVVHPVESGWLETGPASQAQPRLWARDRRFKELLAWLVHGLVDCDLVAESLLSVQQARVEDGRLVVGAMAYDAVLVPELETLRGGTLGLLTALADAGGLLRFVGQAPQRVDARMDARPGSLAGRVGILPAERGAVLAALSGLREVELADAAGDEIPGIFHQLREDGPDRILFLCNSDRRQDRLGLRLRLRGTWQVEALDTATGTTCQSAADQADGWTSLAIDLPAAGHILLRLHPGPARPETRASGPNWRGQALSEPTSVSLDEPNVLLLDRPEWRLNTEAWQAAEEILRVDNRLRVQLGLGLRSGDIPQPWTDRSPVRPLGRVALRYRWQSDVPVAAAKLAIEDPAAWTLRLDGVPVAVVDGGWWVDEDIRTVALPAMPAGEHVLELERTYTRETSLERIYVLGDFSVWLHGLDAVLGAPLRNLHWGDWTVQGLPFYAGGVTYRTQVTSDGGPLRLRAPDAAAPLLKVQLDGLPVGRIAWSPWRLELGRPAAGGHELAITVFGHRRNAFGALHLAKDQAWVGPNVWRTTGSWWCEGYRFRPTGLLAAPEIETPVR